MWVRDRLNEAQQDEEGAVTVDWVVLAAAIVLLGTGVVPVIAQGLRGNADHISERVEAAVSVADQAAENPTIDGGGD